MRCTTLTVCGSTTASTTSAEVIIEAGGGFDRATKSSVHRSRSSYYNGLTSPGTHSQCTSSRQSRRTSRNLRNSAFRVELKRRSTHFYDNHTKSKMFIRIYCNNNLNITFPIHCALHLLLFLNGSINSY